MLILSCLQAIDNFYVGPASQPPPVVVESTLSTTTGVLDTASFVFAPNAAIDSQCVNQTSFHFTGSAGVQILTTQDINLPNSSFIQFDLNLGCNSPGSSSTFDIILEYSTNKGQSWQEVFAFCNPTTTACAQPIYSLGESRYLLNDYYGSWLRTILPLPMTGLTRFRWRNDARAFGSVLASEWAVTNIHIGAGCGRGCGGRGRCISNACQCDAGFVSSNGTCVLNTWYATELRETFDASIASSPNWSLVQGGAVGSSGCGTLTAGTAFVFTSSTNGGRRLVTVDMNTTQATVINFFIRSCSSSGNNPVGLLLAYSTDGGLTFTSLSGTTFTYSYNYIYPNTYYYYNQNLPADITVTIASLPAAAASPATRFMFWQPYIYGSNDNWVCGLHANRD